MFTGIRALCSGEACFRRRAMTEQISKLKPGPSLLGGYVHLMALWTAIAMVLSNPICSRTQGTASQVNGTVMDGSGAIIVGATVTVTNSATGVAYHAATDNLGAYHVTDLPPGTYTMEVSKSGFATQHIRIFTLIVDQLFRQNITLAVGQAEQTVSVSAAALLLDTETSHDQQLI